MRKNRKQITALALALGMTATGMTGFEALAAEGEAEVCGMRTTVVSILMPDLQMACLVNKSSL